MTEPSPRDVEASFEELLRGAVHDIRGPLNQLSALAGLLCAQHKETLGEDGQRLCGYIELAAGRATTVVDALHAYANALRDPEMETVDMDAALGAVKSELAPQIAGRKAVIAGAELGSVTGDRRMLAAVLRELLDNAIKFNRSETPRVDLSARRESGGVEFSVADNGIGIPSDRFEMVFKPLKRLNGFEYAGTGMGLTIARRVIEAHGGRMWVETPAGEGAEVRFTLPSRTTNADGR